MTDPWQFWRDQIAGLEPETTPGTPHAGYYHLRRRITYPNPHPTAGGPRRKVKVYHDPVAIWRDETGWNCLITREEGGASHITNVDAIDNIFSRCCRDALTYEKYLTLVPALEEVA
jgi:hypothetical protein